MDFYNAYSQGFVRVAACTHHAAIGDPATNAASVVGLARQCRFGTGRNRDEHVLADFDVQDEAGDV